MESVVYSSPHWVFTARPDQPLYCSSFLLEIYSGVSFPWTAGLKMHSFFVRLRKFLPQRHGA